MGRLWGLHIKEECPAVPDLAHTVARSLVCRAVTLLLCGAYGFANCDVNRLQRRDDVAPKSDGTVKAGVQGRLGSWSVDAPDPLSQQRGFAETGRGGDERELAVKLRVQPLHQARTRHQLRPDGGNVEVGDQLWHRHFDSFCP